MLQRNNSSFITVYLDHIIFQYVKYLDTANSFFLFLCIISIFTLSFFSEKYSLSCFCSFSCLQLLSKMFYNAVHASVCTLQFLFSVLCPANSCFSSFTFLLFSNGMITVLHGIHLNIMALI